VRDEVPLSTDDWRRRHDEAACARAAQAADRRTTHQRRCLAATLMGTMRHFLGRDPQPMTHRSFSGALSCAALLLALGACSRSGDHADSAGTAPAAAAEPRHAEIGKWGFDLDGMDRNAKPGDDFYEYSNGTWLKTNTIPPDRTSWGAFAHLDEEAETQVRALIEGVPADAAAGTDDQKVRDFFHSYIDTAAIEGAGVEPARKGLGEIAAAKTHADIARLMGRPDLGLSSPINAEVTIDEKNPDRYIVLISQSGLGLPDREYYLGKDPALGKIREEYVAHIGRMLELAGEKDAQAKGKEILALETRVARDHWPVEKRRERELTYNLRTREQLDALAPSFPWKEMLTAAKFDGQKEFVVAELDAVERLGKAFTAVPVSTWRDYLEYHYLVGVADVLPKAFDEENFGFYGRTLNGQQEQRERWKRAVEQIDGTLGEAVGKMYVARHFPPDSKAQMQQLVRNLQHAYEERIRKLEWMSEDTKKVALEKLGTFRPKIGYPDKWKDYSKLEVRAGDAFGNAIRGREFTWQFDVDRLSRPTDKGEWFITPQTVNAYYNPTFNEIVFPAAILQPPYFDPNADAAVNYGTIGGVIGHEMGHGFDDQGAKSDAHGVLRTWWKKEDEVAFKKLVDRLAKQYDGYEALPNLHVNGRLTLGENIGDLGGLSVAYEAYHLSLNGKEAPVLDGMTGDQRFFLGWAQGWRNLMREQRLRNMVMSNPHSPPLFRVQGVVRNMDAWYTAFDVKPDDKLYLKPEDRVHIW
jgi:putative endopeptidase